MITAGSNKYRVNAVSYLNTVPLVWGMLHGEQADQVELTFSIPSICATNVEQGQCDIGLVPVAEIARQGLDIVPGMGITALGAVRSILLFSKVPWTQVRSLAADLSSKTSVQLARVILRERFGVEPHINSQPPLLHEMLLNSDAALIIGDPALIVDPSAQPFIWLDLGQEWFSLTGLPFVFAAWAGKPGLAITSLTHLTVDSWKFGSARLAEIAEHEYNKRNIQKSTAESYLKHHIRFLLGPREYQGLEEFLALAQLPQVSIGAAA